MTERRKCEGCGKLFTGRRNKRFCGRQCQTAARYHDPVDVATPPTHFFIPDTQVEPGRPIDHLYWIGEYARERYAGEPLTRIHIGDHWNMGSLSSYDRGKGRMEGRRVRKDIDAGNVSFEALDGPATEAERELWDDHFFFGNHEDRITRAIESDTNTLDGLLSLDMLDTRGWTRHEYLAPAEIDGVTYAHYFYNPMTGRPYAGANLETRIKTVQTSFSMGHQQGLKWARVETVSGPHIGLVAGSCYLHDEDYLGPQGNDCWRGIVVCHNVENGSYDPMFVSLDYLCRRYEGAPLARYNPKRFV